MTGGGFVYLGDTILQAAWNALQTATTQHGMVFLIHFTPHQQPHVLVHADIVLLHHVARERKDCLAGIKAHAPRGGAHRFGQPFQPLRPILLGRLKLPGLVVVAVGGVAVAGHQFMLPPLLRRAGGQKRLLVAVVFLAGVFYVYHVPVYLSQRLVTGFPPGWGYCSGSADFFTCLPSCSPAESSPARPPQSSHGAKCPACGRS